MKMIVTSLALLSLGVAVPASAVAPAPIEGQWTNPKKSVVIDVDRCGGAYCGRVVWASKKADAKVDGPLVGKQLMSGFTPDGKGGYRGRVLEPRRGLRGTATIKPVGRNMIVVRGCALAGFFCKEQRWHRAGA